MYETDISANQLGLLSRTQIAEQHGQRCLVNHFMFEQVLAPAPRACRDAFRGFGEPRWYMRSTSVCASLSIRRAVLLTVVP